MPKRKLGPYLLSDVLGRGGMGTVYRAEHENTKEICAVKALAPVYACDDHFRTRFESEIKALIKLDHPNIVRLISYGQEEGNLYFAMELVEGNSLFQMQKSGHRFDWRECLAIATDVASGLKHAHDRGIIHRDLKPGNILRATSGINKLTDFGIAKSFGGHQLTGDNVLGTMDFMSPEQAKGRPVTARSDLYSLGTMLFTLLSGRPPFKANSVEESLRNLTRVPPPHVSSVAPDVPPEIDKLIRTLMDKNPEKRVPTAHALLIKIKEIEQSLRDGSEAKTSEQSFAAGDTFVTNVPDPGNPQTVRRSSDKSKISAHETTIHSDDAGGTGTIDSTQQKDYFNTVTDHQRNHAAPVEEKTSPRGLVPIVLGLIGIVLLAGYGLYRVYRIPPVDDLYATIAASDEYPDRVRAEIRQFIQAYPDDERIEAVGQLKDIADAIAVHSNIGVRSRMVGRDRTSDFEKQFLEIVELSKSDPPSAFVRMSAFVTLHDNTDNLDENDKKCISAARGYLIKIGKDADRRVDFNREQIESALARAAEAPADQAGEIYSSIIELYKDREWAADLVSRARVGLGQ